MNGAKFSWDTGGSASLNLAPRLFKISIIKLYLVINSSEFNFITSVVAVE